MGTLFYRSFESLGQYHDHWATIVLCAPDGFRDLDSQPVDQREALDEAFDVLRSGFVFVERKIKDRRQVRIMRELLEMSYEAYVSSDTKAGAHSLQECEGLIWQSRAGRIKYAVEAERRAFGEVITYAHVKISPLPYEGTAADLSRHETQLYDAAQRCCLDYFSRQEDFKPILLVLEPDGTVRDLKSRSWKKGQEELRSLVRGSRCLGFVRAEVAVSGMSGVLVYTIETPNQPQKSVRCLVKNYICEAPRYHLDHPYVLIDDEA
jgi:hypothetical protein